MKSLRSQFYTWYHIIHKSLSEFFEHPVICHSYYNFMIWYSSNAKLSLCLQCLLCVNTIRVIVIWILLTHIFKGISSTCFLCTILHGWMSEIKNIYIHQLCFVLSAQLSAFGLNCYFLDYIWEIHEYHVNVLLQEEGSDILSSRV